MDEKGISFTITNKIKSVPIYKVLKNERLILLEFLMIQNFKGSITPELLFKSTIDSATLLEPVLFKTEKPISFDKKLKDESDSLAVCFLEKMAVDCRKVKLELVIINCEALEEGLVLYAELHYKTFGGGEDNGSESLPGNPKLQIEQKITI